MSRQLVMGDLHGCSDALRALCEVIGLTPADTLITLGDSVHKGPDTRRVIDWLLELDSWLTLVPLRGNHDLLMLNARFDQAAYRRWQRAGGEGILTTIYGILVFLPWWAVQFRRLHDTDRSAWWLLLLLIPVIGWLVILIFNCQRGTEGNNRFGPDPKPFSY